MREFSLYLPPGWYRVDFSEDVDASIESFSSQLVRSTPLSRQPLVRKLIAENLDPRLREFANNGAACLLMPIGIGDANPIKPVVVITPFETPEDIDPLVVLQALVGHDGTAQLVDIEGLVAVRTHASADATEAAEAVQPVLDEILADPATPQIAIDASDLVPAGQELRMVSRRIHYTVGVPADRELWAMVQFAVDYPTTPEAEGLAEEQVEMFDALIKTFRWVS